MHSANLAKCRLIDNVRPLKGQGSCTIHVTTNNNLILLYGLTMTAGFLHQNQAMILLHKLNKLLLTINSWGSLSLHILRSTEKLPIFIFVVLHFIKNKQEIERYLFQFYQTSLTCKPLVEQNSWQTLFLHSLIQLISKWSGGRFKGLLQQSHNVDIMRTFSSLLLSIIR